MLKLYYVEAPPSSLVSSQISSMLPGGVGVGFLPSEKGKQKVDRRQFCDLLALVADLSRRLLRQQDKITNRYVVKFFFVAINRIRSLASTLLR